MNEVEDHYIKDSPVDGCRCSWCEAARDSSESKPTYKEQIWRTDTTATSWSRAH